MYLLMDDASVVRELRDAGFCVIQSNHTGKPQFLVLYSEDLVRFMHSHFPEHQHYLTDTVCF